MKSKEKPVIREFFMDDEGWNKVICFHYEKRIILYLKLKSEGGKKRKIGVITKSTKTMQVRRKRTKHLFLKSLSFGFNEYVLNNATLFDKIWIIDKWSEWEKVVIDGREYEKEVPQKEEWKVPVSFILENGHYLFFKDEGFEKQIFIKLDEIEQFRIKEEENRRF